MNEKINNKEKKDESVPNKVKKPFLKSDKWIHKQKIFFPKFFKKKQPIVEPVQLGTPLLMLIKDNQVVDVIEGVKPGNFRIETPKGKKDLYLTPQKLLSLSYGGEHIPVWIHYENSMTSYPEDPLHTAEMYHKSIMKIAMNYRDRDEVSAITARTKMWLYIIGAVVVAAILFASTNVGKEFFSGLISGGGAEAAVTAVKQNLTNSGSPSGVVIS